jgi:chromosome segregation ATPase
MRLADRAGLWLITNLFKRQLELYMNPIIAANKTALAALQGQVAILSANAETLKSQRDGANQLLGKLQQDLAIANNHITALEQQLVDAGNNTALSQQLAAANAQVAALQAQVTALQGNVLTEEDVAELTAQRTRMQALLQSLSDTNAVTAPGN